MQYKYHKDIRNQFHLNQVNGIINNSYEIIKIKMLKFLVFTGLISFIAASAIQPAQPRLFRSCNPNSANYGPPPLTNTIAGSYCIYVLFLVGNKV
jgi:hypothetical protein